jgi:K+-transporting ATPase ATPase C chain
MKHFVTSLKLTFVTLILFGVIYPLTITAIAWLTTEDHGKGNMKLIGQSFTSDKYFNSRPSAVNYNAAATGGSNKGPSNPGYLKQVEERINDFLKQNPTVKREDVPVDLVTASGGGLDPHISVKAAIVQVDRIAKARHMSSESVMRLIKANTEKPFFGPSRIDVFKINKALNQL